MPDSLYDSWTDITPPVQSQSFDSWTDITPQPQEQSWTDWATSSWLPERGSTVSTFQNTLRGLGVEDQSIIDAASYLPRFGDWTYEKVARPTVSPLGAATLPFSAFRAGRIGLGAIGGLMGSYGLTQEVPEFIENPSFEKGLDVGMNAAMAASPYIGYKMGAFKPNASRPAPPLESGENYWGIGGSGGKTWGFKTGGPKEPAPPRVVDPVEYTPYADLVDEAGNVIPRAAAGELPAAGGASPWNSKPYTPEIIADWIDVTPAAAAPDLPPTTFNASKIDPNVYMTLTRQLGRPPSMAEIEAAQAPNNVVPFTPRSEPPPPDLDAALINMGAGNRSSRGLSDDSAWEESLDDMIHTGPAGVVEPPPVREPVQGNLPGTRGGFPTPPAPPIDTFDESTARALTSHIGETLPEQQSMMPQFLDEEAMQWMRGQDKIIADYQAGGGRLIPDDVAQNWAWDLPSDWKPDHLTPPSISQSPQQLGSGGIQVPGGELLPAEAKQSEFERMFGLQPGEQLTDVETERIKEFYARQLKDMYGEDVVEGQRASDESLGVLGDEKLHYPEMEAGVPRNITPTNQPSPVPTSRELPPTNSLEQPRLPIDDQPELPYSPPAEVQRRWDNGQFIPDAESAKPLSEVLKQPRLNLKSPEYWNKRNIKVSKEMKEQANRAVANLIPEDLDSSLGNVYALSTLRSLDPGPPGFSVSGDYGPNSSISLTYRGPDGRPVAHAKVFTPPEGSPEPAEITTFASDKSKPFLQAKGVHAILKEFVRLGADRPYKDYSEHTKRFMDKARRFLDDEEGSIDLGAFGKEFDAIKNYAGRALKNENGKTKLGAFIDKVTNHEITKKVLAETKRLIKDETGSVTIPSWKDIKNSTGIGMGRSKQTGPPPAYNALHEMIMLPAGATTTGDLSAPGRQGLGLIHTPQFWNALLKMPQGLWAPQFDKIDNELRKKQIFQPMPGRGGRPGKSLAEEAGLELMIPASSNRPGPRAQQIASKWLETGGFLGPERIFGKIPNVPRSAYKHTVGYPIRATNRAYITFLNTLRANRFEYLVNRAEDMAVSALSSGTARPGFIKQKYNTQEAMELHPYSNLNLAKEIADFVNTATGAGPLKTHVLPHRAAEWNLEAAAEKLSYVLFSPGLMASRVRMLNPNTYVMASPMVRKEYMKSALATAGAWFAFTTMLKIAAEAMGLEDVEVNNENLTSADFGKVKIGERFRMDPAGGFQQFLVNIGRAWQGGTTSSATGEFHKFGEGFRAETQRSNIERFFVNKLQPVAKLAYDIADADAYQPFHVYDRMAQLAVPLYLQDIYELVKENPLLLPIAAPATLLGFGSQMYGKGESVGSLVDPENDWIVEGGGGIRSLAPWNWGAEDYEMKDFPWSEPD